MKKYFVFRKLVLRDSCIVEAKNKTDAIRKAKDSEFSEDEYESGWETGDVLKAYGYEAEVEE